MDTGDRIGFGASSVLVKYQQIMREAGMEGGREEKVKEWEKKRQKHNLHHRVRK